MASSHDEKTYPARPLGAIAREPITRNTAFRRKPGLSANQGQRLPFATALLPIIALAAFGQIASFDRLSTPLPEIFSFATRGPAYPPTPVISQILPPLVTPKPATELSAGGAQTLTVSRGDTLQSLLTEGGVSWDDAQQAVSAIKKFFDPRDLHVGQKLSVILAPTKAADAGQTAQLTGVSIVADVDRMVVAKRQADGGFASQEVVRPLTQTSRLVSAPIESSLFEAALTAKIRPEIIVEMIRLFSYDVDFQRDIQPGDSFDVLYDRDLDENGRVARTGAIRYAALTLGNVRKELFRFAPPGGEFEYFDQNGHGAQKALMKTPVDGAKLSSRFGMRKHPILGYTRMHKGLDFATATGTPVMAAGQGFVEMAGWNGAYGKYIRIRHNDGYSTAYGHLSGFGKGVRKGMRVRQGQIIGYTGSTGRSTGPHLHYEVLAYGAQVNPQSMKLPTAQALTGKELAQFKKLRDAIGNERTELAQKPVETAGLR
jgi:murein DD-endopeptidase MepM/ murein hydrolase activator NlpD